MTNTASRSALRLTPALLAVALVAVSSTSIGGPQGMAQLSTSSLLPNLTSAQVGDGIKEALGRGISAAVASASKSRGYFDNPAIKIGMPSNLQLIDQLMHGVGMGTQVDAFVKSMNTAAEKAAPAAKPILLDALRSMTIEDARGILAGGPTAGTDYFKRIASSRISDAFRPIVDREMGKIGVAKKFQALMEKSPSAPFMKTPTVDINNYVLQKSVDGLFTVMGQEEAKIRTNPAAQVTPLLKTVFGGR